ncbi:hypothetical protein P3W45_001674 [Vairimorpha bombi]|jgi:hypothetical protein
MENLLLDILKSPTDVSIQKVESLLDTQEGIDMFVTLLSQNNVIAFTYMKMQVKEWLLNPIRQDFILKYKNTFFNLIYDTTPQNLNLLCDFFEILFLQYFYWPDFVDYLVAKNDPRSFKVLNSLFVKFRKLHKSDKLYLEIIECIEKTKTLYEKYYFCTEPTDDENFLNMFYSLIYQDIHCFFEDNIEKFINAMCKLFKKKKLQSTICEMYNLFIMKYPDLIDFTKILGAVLISIDSFDYAKYQVLLNIIKKRKDEACIKFEDILVNACKLGSVLSVKEKDEMGSLEYSKNIICNIDVYRGIIIDLVLNLSKNNSSFVTKLLSSPYDEESEIFLYTALKLKNDDIVKKCQIIINNSSSDIYMSFSAFRYLLVVKEYSTCDNKFIQKDHPSVYLCLEMITKYIQKTSPLEINILDILTNQDINKDIVPEYIEILDRIIIFINGSEEDQYSCILINRIIKEDIRYMTDDIYNFLIEYTNLNIRNINSVLAFQYLFDTFGILMTKGNQNKKLIYERDFGKLISIITAEEIVEMYNYTFFLLSIIIKNSKNEYSSVIQIVSQDRLWGSKELLMSLICLSVSLYKKKYMSDEQINYITQYLCTVNKYYAYLLSDNTNFTLRINEDVEEYFILKSIIIENIEEYYKIYKSAMEYFTNNYISKKNVRRIVRSFIRGSKIVHDEMYKNIIEKNIFNLSYDNVPYCVYINFEI